MDQSVIYQRSGLMSFASISAAITSSMIMQAAVSAAISVGISAVTAALTPDPPDINLQGPRMGDLKVQSSTYGNAIPIVYGSIRLAGNMIWSTPIIETAHVTSQESGGKGFGGSQTVNNTNYTYSQSFAIALCEGEIIGVRKIWANGEIIYNVADDADIHTLAASNANTAGIRFYTGSETQLPDARIQADVGAANCPAYRGLAYVVFEDLQLADYGNRTPNLEFEVIGAGAITSSPWVQLTAAAPFSKRNSNPAVVHNGLIFTIGGQGDASIENDVWASPDGEHWTLVTDSPGFAEKYGHTAVVHNNRIYVIGGSDSGAILTNDVWSSPDGINWTQETAGGGGFIVENPESGTVEWSSGPLVFQPRKGHASVILNDRIYVIGGYGDDGEKSDVWSSTNGQQWTLVTENAGFGARQDLAAAVLNGRIYIMGGFYFGEAGAGDDVGYYDVWSSADGETWTLETNDAPFGTWYLNRAVALNGKIYVVGHNVGADGDVWSSENGSVWEMETATAEYGQRWFSGVAAMNGVIYLIGGWDGTFDGGTHNDVWAWASVRPLSKTAPTLDSIVSDLCERAGLIVGASTAAVPAGESWTEQTAAADFSARMFHAAASLNGVVYVIGGYAAGPVLKNDVWSSLDGVSWVQQTAAAGFSARYGHAVVVLDGVIYIIGGADAGGYKNDVWSSTDGVTWTQETAVAGFSARYGHAVVVLDGLIYIIGGADAGGNKNDVWSSPDGVSWTQVTADAGFWVRSAHAAVVLNGVIYIMGGADVGNMNDVWSSLDGASWAQVTAAADFSARNSHAAVAINGTIYIVGGIADGGMLKNDVWTSSDGATWTQVTAAAEFAARSSFAGLINDTLLYVIGGFTIGGAKNDVWSWFPGSPAVETPSDVDATSLAGESVDGYMVSKNGAARAAIEPLMQAFYFDAIESGGQVKFVKRGQSPIISIPEEDLAAHAYGSAVPDQLIMNRAQEMELPVEISIQYLDRDAAYGVGTQYARRLTTPSRNKTAMQLQMSLAASKAKQIVDVLLYDAWTARTSFTLSLSNKYAWLEPTDVVQVTKGGRTYTARLTDKDEATGIHSYTAVLEDAQIYSQNAVAASLPAPVETVTMVGPTHLQLLDIPLLRDQDDGAGFYAAACGYLAGWRGAQLFKSIDAGASYEQYGPAFLKASTIGSANDVLGDFAGGNSFDETNTVTVHLINGTLASLTELAVLNGGNVALLGDEIIQFKNAALTDANTYTLSGLLRGRQGTEWSVSEHTAGERFVLLSAGTTYIEQAVSSELGLARKYRAATLGGYLADAIETEFTHNSVAQKCYAPAQLGGGRDADGNITLNWVRRSRIGGSWNSFTDVPLGESSESYVIEIYTAADYATLKRALTSTTPTAQYTSAQQVDDFGSNQSVVYWRVAQVSAAVGNGYFERGIL
jgi:hypothetical protein